MSEKLTVHFLRYFFFYLIIAPQLVVLSLSESSELLSLLDDELDIRCKDFNGLLTDLNNFLLHLKSFMLISV